MCETYSRSDPCEFFFGSCADVLWHNKRKQQCGSHNSSSNNDEPTGNQVAIDLVHHSAAAAFVKHHATGRHWASGPPAKRNSSSAVYITLAAESPVRSAEDSEDSVYDSFHGRDTGEVFFFLNRVDVDRLY